MDEESTSADRITEKSRGKISQAERDMHGADGRWLLRGAVEKRVGSDRTACYSGRVYGCIQLVPDEVSAVRQRRTEVVTRVLYSSSQKEGTSFFYLIGNCVPMR